jgi:putative colanic acid biosynthesis glycosyltransferase
MTIKTPCLSIITITKDDPAGLAKTTASLKAQTCNNFEWIVVDGNKEPDNGRYDAMNKGIERASGKYILFLNGGDQLADPEVISILERHTSILTSDLIYGDALEEINGKLMVKRARKPKTIARGMFTHHQAIIYNRNTLGKLRYKTDYEIAGDYDFTARFLKNCEDISYIPAGLCLFEEGGISQQNAKLGRKEEYRAKLENKLCGPFQAKRYYMRQAIAAGMRKKLPGLYNMFRSNV